MNIDKEREALGLTVRQLLIDNGIDPTKADFADIATVLQARASMQDDVRKDAERWRMVSFAIEQSIQNGSCYYDIEQAYEDAIAIDKARE